MATSASHFRVCRPTPWVGRYARIPGENSVFHLRSVEGRMWPTIQWQTEEGTGTCSALPCTAAEQMAGCREGQGHAGGGGGGAFVINEFGQVLVPASDGGGRRFLAGQLEGRHFSRIRLKPMTRLIWATAPSCGPVILGNCLTLVSPTTSTAAARFTSIELMTRAVGQSTRRNRT